MITSEKKNRDHVETFLKGGGEMGALIRSTDWTKTPIGSPDNWPPVLRLAVRMILDTPFPMYIAWGDEYTQIYNDGFRPILGANKHPQAMGGSTRMTFEEIWSGVGPMFEEVRKGNAMRFTDLMYVLDRNGYPEDCYFDFSYSPLRLEDGTVGGIFVTVLETTEKIKFLKQVKESELNFRNMIEQAPVAICVLKGPYHVVEIVNDDMLKIFGKELEEVLNKPIFEGLPESRNQGLETLLDEVFLTGVRFTAKERPVSLPRENGLELVYQNFVYEPLRDNDGKISGVIVATVDVTEQVLARQHVELLEERTRLATDAGNLGTFDLDLVTRQINTSKRFCEIMDVPPDSPHDILLGQIHPDDQAIRDKAFQTALDTGQLYYEIRIKKRNGHWTWIRVEGKVLFDQDQKPYRMIGTTLDITMQKEFDARREEYIAIASHELRNPLATLKLSVDLLLAMHKNDQTEWVASRAKVQLDRIMNMTNEFLNVSKISSGLFELKKEIFNLRNCIEESITTFQEGIIKNPIQLSGVMDMSISADKFRIEQVLINLISNASKYSPKGEEIIIRCSHDAIAVKIEVIDKGIGISSEKLPMVFKKFSRLEAGNQVLGYGLGLYISEQIIQKHGGTIGVESEKGKGSVFWFTLPL